MNTLHKKMEGGGATFASNHGNTSYCGLELPELPLEGVVVVEGLLPKGELDVPLIPEGLPRLLGEVPRLPPLFADEPPSSPAAAFNCSIRGS